MSWRQYRYGRCYHGHNRRLEHRLHDGVLVRCPGGWLGHAATAARELGIPCVVDCTGLTAVVGEGRTVHVNGQTGVVPW